MKNIDWFIDREDYILNLNEEKVRELDSNKAEHYKNEEIQNLKTALIKENKQMEEYKRTLEKIRDILSLTTLLMMRNPKLNYVLLKEIDVNELIGKDDWYLNVEDMLSEFWLSCIKYSKRDYNKDTIKYKACLYKMYKLLPVRYFFDESQNRYFCHVNISKNHKAMHKLDLQIDSLRNSLNEFVKEIEELENQDAKDINCDKIFSDIMFKNMEKNKLIIESEIDLLIQKGLNLDENEKYPFYSTINAFEYKDCGYKNWLETGLMQSYIMIQLHCINLILNTLLTSDAHSVYVIFKKLTLPDFIATFNEKMSLFCFKNHHHVWNNISKDEFNNATLNACIFRLYEVLFPAEEGQYLLGVTPGTDKYGADIPHYYKLLKFEDVEKIISILYGTINDFIKEVKKNKEKDISNYLLGGILFRKMRESNLIDNEILLRIESWQRGMARRFLFSPHDIM